MSMRVVVVQNSLGDNGGLRVSLTYAGYWQAAGLPTEVVVLMDATSGAVAHPDPALRITMVTAPGRRFRFSVPAAMVRLVRRVRTADVVVVGSESGPALICGYLAARFTRKPLVVQVQADIEEKLRTWIPTVLHRPTRWIWSHADAAVCVSQSVLDGVVANGLPPSRAHLVGNGIDVAAVRALAAETRTADAHPDTAATIDRRPVVTALGRLNAVKDFDLLLRAHAKVLASGIDHRLVIIGEGSERSALEATVAELGVGDTAELAGYVDNPYATIAAAEVFVLSSRVEGMPLSVIEALAIGTPVIATRCGTGTELILADGEFGDLVPAGSVDELAAAIERHLDDPGRLRAKAAGGPRRALEFDMARSARTVGHILRELVG